MLPNTLWCPGTESKFNAVTAPDAAVVQLAHHLRARIPAIASDGADLIFSNVDFYKSTTVVSREDALDRIRAVGEYLLNAMTGQPLDLTSARATGVDRAIAGVPLHAVLGAYRVGFRYVWDIFRTTAAEQGNIPPDSLLDLATLSFNAQEEFAQAMSTAYADQMTLQILGQEQERASLVEALLAGRISTTEELWNAADVLRLPTGGPFAVVAVEVPEIGKLGLPLVESKLDAKDIRSAWQLLPDLQVGIVFLRHATDRKLLIEILEQLATTRVGISPLFVDLAQTANGLRLARLALTAKPDGDSQITTFDARPLAYAAVSSPDVMRHIEATVLGTLNELPVEDRAVLLDTFGAWVDAGGNTGDTARKLFCHPNTVRQRLRRIEEHTGRSLTAPRDIAELCLAFEISQRLP